MTCKDCIGYPFCSRGRNGQTNFYGKDIACNNVEYLCKDFKNKADFVEVVRCKDCHYKEHWEKTKEGFYYCKVSGLVVVEDNDFCSYGEQKSVTDTNVGGK